MHSPALAVSTETSVPHSSLVTALRSEGSEDSEERCREVRSQERTREEGRTRLDWTRAPDAIARALGMDDDWGPCPLPGHYGVAGLDLLPLLPVVFDPLTQLPFLCDCNGTEILVGPYASVSLGRSWFHRPLADVYHAIWTGRELNRKAKLSKGMRAVWTLLLAERIGLLESVPVEMPPASPYSPDVAHPAAALFARLAGLRFAAGSDNALPMPFSVTLVQDYCRLDRGTAYRAIRALVESGVIVKVGEEQARGGLRYGTALYRPGGVVVGIR